MDKVLTIIPIYNKGEFLEGAIESVLQQTHKNIELVLVDDCSTDKSLEIAKSYEHLDNVTVLRNSKNRGCYYTRNKGLKYFKNKSETIRYEKKLKEIFKKARVEVLTYAYNQRKDGKSLKPKKTLGTLANGGNECYEEKSIPNSFAEIDKILN